MCCERMNGGAWDGVICSASCQEQFNIAFIYGLTGEVNTPYTEIQPDLVSLAVTKVIQVSQGSG